MRNIKDENFKKEFNSFRGSNMDIKICGITAIEEIQDLNILKPEYIGFVFAESKRKISKEQGKLLYDSIDRDIKVVGVFRDNTKEI